MDGSLYQRSGPFNHLPGKALTTSALPAIERARDADKPILLRYRKSRTHHTNMDVLESLQPAGLQQAAAIVATFVYHTAMRDERLPRSPLPAPPAP